MAAKKKRGLSGSPEHHKQMASAYEKNSVDGFDDAIQSAKIGDCVDAFISLRYAERSAGHESAHRQEVEPRNRLALSKKEESLLVKAMDASGVFAKHCLVGGGLSGMKRRSRR